MPIFRRDLPKLTIWCSVEGCEVHRVCEPVEEVEQGNHTIYKFQVVGPDTRIRENRIFCPRHAAEYDKSHSSAPPPKSLEERLLVALDALDEVRKLSKAERELAGEDVKASVDALVGLLDAAEPYAEVLKKILGKATEAA